MTIVPMQMDDHGLIPSAVEDAFRANPAPAFIYTIPTFQNPSGRTMPEERRRQLVAHAQTHSTLILEDDPYGLVRFEGEAPPAIFDLARESDDLHLLVLEDGLARPSRRLLHRPRESLAGPLIERANIDLHHAGAAQRGGRLRVHPARQLRAEPARGSTSS